jgi:hypothetical protein
MKIHIAAKPSSGNTDVFSVDGTSLFYCAALDASLS